MSESEVLLSSSPETTLETKNKDQPTPSQNGKQTMEVTIEPTKSTTNTVVENSVTAVENPTKTSKEKNLRQTGFLVDQDPSLRRCLGNQASLLRPHESFAFKLGLEVVMSAYNNNNNNNNNKNENRNDALVDLNRPLSSFEMKQCPECDFRTESAAVLDQHMSEPHSKLIAGQGVRIVCLYCDEFYTRSREEYRSHVELEHKRVCSLESAFVNDAFMCLVCDFEVLDLSDEYTAIERVERHIDSICPFREEVISSRPYAQRLYPQLDMRRLLENQLSPSELDLLRHEFVFNSRPRDRFVQFRQFFSSLLNNSTTSASSLSSHQNLVKQLEDREQRSQIQLYKSLIQEDNPAVKFPSGLRFNLPLPKLPQIPVQQSLHGSLPQQGWMQQQHSASYDNEIICLDSDQQLQNHQQQQQQPGTKKLVFVRKRTLISSILGNQPPGPHLALSTINQYQTSNLFNGGGPNGPPKLMPLFNQVILAAPSSATTSLSTPPLPALVIPNGSIPNLNISPSTAIPLVLPAPTTTTISPGVSSTTTASSISPSSTIVLNTAPTVLNGCPNILLPVGAPSTSNNTANNNNNNPKKTVITSKTAKIVDMLSVNNQKIASLFKQSSQVSPPGHVESLFTSTATPSNVVVSELREYSKLQPLPPPPPDQPINQAQNQQPVSSMSNEKISSTSSRERMADVLSPARVNQVLIPKWMLAVNKKTEKSSSSSSSPVKTSSYARSESNSTESESGQSSSDNNSNKSWTTKTRKEPPQPQPPPSNKTKTTNSSRNQRIERRSLQGMAVATNNNNSLSKGNNLSNDIQSIRSNLTKNISSSTKTLPKTAPAPPSLPKPATSTRPQLMPLKTPTPPKNLSDSSPPVVDFLHDTYLTCRLCHVKFKFDKSTEYDKIDTHYSGTHKINLNAHMPQFLLKLRATLVQCSDVYKSRDILFTNKNFTINRALVPSSSQATTPSNQQQPQQLQQQQAMKRKLSQKNIVSPNTTASTKISKINQMNDVKSSGGTPSFPAWKPSTVFKIGALNSSLPSSVDMSHQQQQSYSNKSSKKINAILNSVDRTSSIETPFEAEKNLIRACLKNYLSGNVLDSTLLELNQLAGKCYICAAAAQHQQQIDPTSGYLADLIGHMRDTHGITINVAYARRLCLCCGEQLDETVRLIQHLYDRHKILAFSSLNKIFYVNNNTTTTNTINHSNNNNNNGGHQVQSSLSATSSVLPASSSSSSSLISVASPRPSTISLSVRKLHEVSSQEAANHTEENGGPSDAKKARPSLETSIIEIKSGKKETEKPNDDVKQENGEEKSKPSKKLCELCGLKCEDYASFQLHLTSAHPRLTWCRVQLERIPNNNINKIISSQQKTIKTTTTTSSLSSSSISILRSTSNVSEMTNGSGGTGTRSSSRRTSAVRYH